jgi:hypothetical protein
MRNIQALDLISAGFLGSHFRLTVRTEARKQTEGQEKLLFLSMKYVSFLNTSNVTFHKIR